MRFLLGGYVWSFVEFEVLLLYLGDRDLEFMDLKVMVDLWE